MTKATIQMFIQLVGSALVESFIHDLSQIVSFASFWHYRYLQRKKKNVNKTWRTARSVDTLHQVNETAQHLQKGPHDKGKNDKSLASILIYRPSC